MNKRQLIVETDLLARDLAKHLKEHPELTARTTEALQNPLDLLDEMPFELRGAEEAKLVHRLDQLSEQTTGPYECVRLGILFLTLVGKHLSQGGE